MAKRRTARLRVAGGGNESAARKHRETQSLKVPESELAFADPYWLFGGRSAFTVYNPGKLPTAQGLRIFDEIRRDDQAKASLAFKKQAVLAPGWDLVPAKGAGEEDEATAFVRDNFDKIEGTLESCLTQVLSALDYGYSITEKVYEESNGKIWLKALKTKKPHPFSFVIDGYGNLKGLNQEGNDAKLPPLKFLIYRYQYEFGNPYGTSDLDAAYRAWWSKNNAYKWLGMLLEKYGIPPVVAMYSPDAFKGAQVDRLKTVLERMQASTVALVPRNTKEQLDFWSPELAGQVSQAFAPAMQMYNQDIARAILMPGFLGVTPDTQGSYARARVTFEMFMFAVEYLRKDLANAVNESVVQQLVALNFATDPPEFKFLPLTNDERIGLLDTWLKFVKEGAVKPTGEDEIYIRERLDFPERLDAMERPPELREPRNIGGFGQ
jgi:phage gp29-like protein